MKFDDDDLQDYNDEEPTPEEEEQLYELTPLVKQQLIEYTGFTDEDIREALWYNYMEIDDALKELKKKFKKEPKKPMSKIAALAKARAAQRVEQSSTKTSVAILDKLKENRDPNGIKPTIGGISLLKSRKKTADVQEKQVRQVKQETIKQEAPKKRKSEPLITLQSIPSTTPISTTPQGSFSTVFAPPQKKRVIDQALYSVFTPTNYTLLAQVKANFSKPSPDDIALNAQTSAFEKKQVQLEQKISQLTISTPKQSTKPIKSIDLKAEITKRQLKPSTSFVVIGHVDAGKSTLTGRLLLDAQTVSMSTYNKLKREAEKSGKSSFSLAWVMDQTPEERNRGVTIDICSSFFETDKMSFTIVDAPGHRDFVPNMISGVAQADIAILVIDSSTDAFEKGFHLDGQTKEHTILARSLGISRLVIAINKLDNVDWSQTRFDQIKGLMTQFLQMTGWSSSQIAFVPCSGLSGTNVSNPPKEKNLTNWYKGPTLLQALEGTETQNRDFQKPFVMQLTEIDSSTEFTGRIDTGSIQPGETVLFTPSNVAGVVDSIMLKDTKTSLALAGDSVTIKVKNADLQDVRVGDIMSIVSFEIPSVTKFECRIVMFDMERPLLVGMPFVLFRGNVQQPAKIVKIVNVYDRLGQVDSKKRKVKHLSAKQSAYVVIESERKIPLQLYKDNKLMGRIVLRKDGRTIGAGIVEKI